MPRQAFYALLSDSPLLYQTTPRSLLNSRALTTPSVEKLTEHVAQFGPVGEGRPSTHQQPFSTSFPKFSLDPDTPYDSVFDNCYHVKRSTHYSAHPRYSNSTQSTLVNDFIANEISPLLPSISVKSPQEVFASNPIPHNYSSSSDVAYKDHYRLYQVIDNVLSPSTLRVCTPEEVCNFLLSLAEGWDFKMTIYSVVESLLDHAIQSGYPQNCDLVSLCSLFMEGIGIRWRSQMKPTIYQEFMAESLVDIFKDAWTTLLTRGPSRHPLLDRICAFYGELYFKGVLSLTQYFVCYDVVKKTPQDCRPPMALFYLTSVCDIG
ncbi:hypothetical protein Clacol_000390 [Clathrus columnatus]|uniref:Uncharacterized protein n=1 Tax=Clathrus columnatus TaxID=1419009 RepID=A0AAV5A0U1_9AGAM|nr:hypothetical protein Clacol_000390 [Clathrus columnatus]